MTKTIRFTTIAFVVGFLVACGGVPSPTPSPTLAVQVQPEVVFVDQEVSVHAEISGVDASDARITWTLPAGQGSLSPSTGTTVTWATPATAGTVIITATAASKTNAFSEISDSVTVSMHEEVLQSSWCDSGYFFVEDDPRILSTIEQIQAISESPERMAGHYKLGTDIDASATAT